MICYRNSGAFQSTRPRGARHVPGQSFHEYLVSIHAPARGATKGNGGAPVPCVSIHAPARGATPPRGRRSKQILFQSTRPRGARPRCSCAAPCNRIVSIHAPARGATGLHLRTTATHSRFNPRARAGRDSAARKLSGSTSKFQSTRPRGARQMAEIKETIFGVFQSTRPRGARRRPARHRGGEAVFQSTRPRGARQDSSVD